MCASTLMKFEPMVGFRLMEWCQHFLTWCPKAFGAGLQRPRLAESELATDAMVLGLEKLDPRSRFKHPRQRR